MTDLLTFVNIGTECEMRNEDVALGIRRREFERSIRNNGGYLGQACSAAGQTAWRYREELKLGRPALPTIPEAFGGVPLPNKPDDRTWAGCNNPAETELDRPFIAPAHCALVACATPIEVGARRPKAW